MKTVLLIAISLLMSSYVLAEDDVAKGQHLFAQSHCLECHGTDAFIKPERKIKNLTQLEQKVRTCDANLNINWFDDEILSVVKYLNTAFYKFPDPSSNNTLAPTTTPPPNTLLSTHPLVDR